MTNLLSESLAGAAEQGRKAFEGRNLDRVIAPAAQRVRRHRTLTAMASAAGVVVLAVGVLWGAQVFGTPGPTTLEPAATPTSTAANHGDADVLGDALAWSTVQFAAAAEPRKMGEKRIDAVAGMICHHATPDDDPRIQMKHTTDATVSHITSVADCAPVWFYNGPFTSDSDLGVSTSDHDAKLTTKYLISNDSPQPLEIDRNSVFIWVETDPGTVSTQVAAVYPGGIIGDSMWSAPNTTTAVIDSFVAPTSIQSHEHLLATSTLADPVVGSGSTIADLINSGKPFTVSVWARIHEDDPSGDATYLVQLGTTHSYGVRRD